MMPGWHILLPFILVSSAWVLADTHRFVSTPGKMRIRGNIIEAACYIDLRDRSLLVKFDDLSIRDIPGKPERVSAHDFSIYLLGYSLRDFQRPGNLFQRADITFSGAPGSGNPDYLSMRSETEDLMVEIYDGKDRQVRLGEPSPDYTPNPGEDTFNFTAYLISHDGRMTSGEFAAVTHFVVNYL